MGLTGSEKDISEAAKAYRVYYKRTEETLNSEAADSENYIMDHSAYIYLISPNDKYIRHFVRGQEPKEIAIAVKKNL